jgi:hypothetical protein
VYLCQRNLLQPGETLSLIESDRMLRQSGATLGLFDVKGCCANPEHLWVWSMGKRMLRQVGATWDQLMGNVSCASPEQLWEQLMGNVCCASPEQLINEYGLSKSWGGECGAGVCSAWRRGAASGQYFLLTSAGSSGHCLHICAGACIGHKAMRGAAVASVSGTGALVRVRSRFGRACGQGRVAIKGKVISYGVGSDILNCNTSSKRHNNLLMTKFNHIH